VDYTDSPTTAATAVSIPGGSSTFSALVNDGNFTALDAQSGTLGGLLLWDSATQDENFYSSALFTSAVPLLTGVSGTPLACVGIESVLNGERDYLSGNYFAAVKTSAGYGSYEFTASGTAHQFFAGEASGCVADSANLYFIGTPTGATTASIYQESLSSLVTPEALLTLPPQAAAASESLIGSNGTLLVLADTSVNGSGVLTTTIETLPLGKSSAAGTSIGGPYTGGPLTDFLASPNSGAAGADVLFLSELNQASSGGTSTISFTGQVLNPAGAGTTLQSNPNSVWESFGPFTTELDGNVILVKDIIDTTGAFGGAVLYQVSVASLNTPVGLTPPGSTGAAYVVPSGYQVTFTGFYGTTIATGGLVSLTHAAGQGVAVDVSHHVIVPLFLTNTNVAPML
jgi:hypothetical protein